MKRKLKRGIGLFVMMILIVSPILATTSENYHQKVDKDIQELLLLQNQIFTLAQNIVFPETEPNKEAIKSQMNLVEKKLNEIGTELNYDLSKFPIHEREIRLLLTAINYMRNSIYELENILKVNSAPEKMLDLENYFNFRVYARNSINFAKRFTEEN